MALTIALDAQPDGRTFSGARQVRRGTITFDSSYPTGGEAITKTNLFLHSLDELTVYPTSGLVFEWDKTNGKIIAYRSAGFTPAGTNSAPAFTGSAPTFTGTAPVGSTVNFTDSDGAAAAGVAVYAHVDEVLEQGTALAHLEFVSPTNADATFTINNGGPTCYVQDDDLAATGGFQVYLDEDGTAGSKLLANTGRDCYVMLSNGEFVKITHNADPGTPGVAIYLDEDAANSYQRILFVSPTNANATDTCPANVAMRRETPAGTNATVTGTVAAPTFTGTAVAAAALVEVANATNLSAIVARFRAEGK